MARVLPIQFSIDLVQFFLDSTRIIHNVDSAAFEYVCTAQSVVFISVDDSLTLKEEDCRQFGLISK